MNKMKICIQLYGHLRTFQITAPYLFRNLINPNLDVADFDILIHTWDELDAGQQMPHYSKKKEYMGRKLTLLQLEDIRKLYHPRKMLIDQQKDLTDGERREIKNNNGSTILASAFKNGFYSFCQVNRLRESYEKEKNFTYDYVLTTRPDILFFGGGFLISTKYRKIQEDGSFLLMMNRFYFHLISSDIVM